MVAVVFPCRKRGNHQKKINQNSSLSERLRDSRISKIFFFSSSIEMLYRESCEVQTREWLSPSTDNVCCSRRDGVWCTILKYCQQACKYEGIFIARQGWKGRALGLLFCFALFLSPNKVYQCALNFSPPVLFRGEREHHSPVKVFWGEGGGTNSLLEGFAVARTRFVWYLSNSECRDKSASPHCQVAFAASQWVEIFQCHSSEVGLRKNPPTAASGLVI